MPADWIRRQTVKNAERYITTELKQFEDQVLGARDRALARERELYEALLDAARREPLAGAADDAPRRSPTLDVLANLAERARAELAKPTLIDESCLDDRGGRHLVVEQVLDAPFVPNDLELRRRRAAC